MVSVTDTSGVANKNTPSEPNNCPLLKTLVNYLKCSKILESM